MNFDSLIHKPSFTIAVDGMIREIKQHGLEGQPLYYHPHWTLCNCRMVPGFPHNIDAAFMTAWINGVNE